LTLIHDRPTFSPLQHFYTRFFPFFNTPGKNPDPSELLILLSHLPTPLLFIKHLSFLLKVLMKGPPLSVFLPLFRIGGVRVSPPSWLPLRINFLIDSFPPAVLPPGHFLCSIKGPELYAFFTCPHPTWSFTPLSPEHCFSFFSVGSWPGPHAPHMFVFSLVKKFCFPPGLFHYSNCPPRDIFSPPSDFSYSHLFPPGRLKQAVFFLPPL